VTQIFDLRGLGPEEIARRLARKPQAAEDVGAAVDDILRGVRERGDEALREYARIFDGAEIGQLTVPREELQAAAGRIDPFLAQTLQEARENIRAFHEKQIHQNFVLTRADGAVMGQRYTPIERVGVCVPSTPTAFPSTVLMNVVPAVLAGVSEIVVVTAPARDGSIADAALAAAYFAGATRVIRSGGAQAVAAMAYGTQSVPRVDKIVGPGGIYVATAKRKVFGLVDIDMIAGPSEILVLADGGCDPRWVAADLLSQAEHDRLASAVLATDSPTLAQAVQAELEVQLETLPRREVARAALERGGRILLLDDLDRAAEAANDLAPEHLELCVDDPFALLGKIRNAGSVFLGRSAPEALGDYFAGPNHTLPTAGTARFSSPLGVDDFVKRSSFLYYPPQALRQAAPKIAAFAREEGLEAHARSVTIRCEETKKGGQ
jgi:histidinol dehydrogenase